MDLVLSASMAIGGVATWLLFTISGRSNILLNILAAVAVIWLSVFAGIKLEHAVDVDLGTWTGQGEFNAPTVLFMALGVTLWFLGDSRNARGV